MKETAHFVNEGFGWECKRCRGDGGEPAAGGDGESSAAAALPRFFCEGEAEGGDTRLSSHALARWKDDSRAALCCPACGVEEEFKG